MLRRAVAGSLRSAEWNGQKKRFATPAGRVSLEDSIGDFSYTLRTLLRSPGFAIVAILTLAIGIGGTTAVFSAVDAVLLQPLPYAQPGCLVRLYQSRINAGERGFVTPVHYVELRNRASSFEAMAAIATYDEVGADIGVGDSVRRVHVLPISADYFNVVSACTPEFGTWLAVGG